MVGKKNCIEEKRILCRVYLSLAAVIASFFSRTSTSQNNNNKIIGLHNYYYTYII